MKFHLASLLSLPLAALAADTNALPALSPAYPEMPPTFWEQHGAAILIGGFVFAVLAAIGLSQMLKPRPQPVLPPEIIVRHALAKLQRQPEDGNVLSEISQSLRRYISAAFQFPPGELTTAEFSAALAGDRKIGAELAPTISNFLRECDERKFSPTNASAPLNAAPRALELVERIEKRRAEPAAQTSAAK